MVALSVRIAECILAAGGLAFDGTIEGVGREHGVAGFREALAHGAERGRRPQMSGHTSTAAVALAGFQVATMGVFLYRLNTAAFSISVFKTSNNTIISSYSSSYESPETKTNSPCATVFLARRSFSSMSTPLDSKVEESSPRVVSISFNTVDDRFDSVKIESLVGILGVDSRCSRKNAATFTCGAIRSEPAPCP